ncbi:MAG: histidinol-phosphate aminotransferase family protein [Ignavibacteriales bacterium]|nr:histidinol-phosphate aminotransferase family protein [Ignavibacteriales bacterium]
MNRRRWLWNTGALVAAQVVGPANVFPARALRLGGEARLQSNENPYGPSAAARKAMAEAFNEGNLYTGLPTEEFRALMAEVIGVTQEHIVVGAGSAEILKVAPLLAGREKAEIVAAHPTFESLVDYARNIGAAVQQVPLDESMRHDLSEMHRRVTGKTTLVYVCNPNNPTGTLVKSGALQSFCEDVSKQALVFVDEAYHEYVEDPDYHSMVPLVQKGYNVIVSRTASKIHGLAGMRVGFGIGQPDTMRKLQRLMTGSVNVVGLRGAIASYKDKDFQDFTKKKCREGKELLYRLFDEHELRYMRSEGNFVFFRSGQQIENFRPAMKEHGVLVARPFPPYGDWCRVSMGTDEEMKKLEAALPIVLGASAKQGKLH